MSRRSDEFERIVLPHTGSILRFARRLAIQPAAADDLTQETLLLAWRGFHQFAPGSNVRAWLFRILMNVHYGYHRRGGGSESQSGVSCQPNGSKDTHLELIEVADAFDRLHADQRAVLYLGVIEGFTCKEIAAILGIPMGTVMSRLSRARDALRRALTAATAKVRA